MGLRVGDLAAVGLHHREARRSPMSAARSTAINPAARERDRMIAACAWGLRTKAAWTMPGRLDVVQIAGLAAQNPGVLAPGQRLADHPTPEARGSSRRRAAGS